MCLAVLWGPAATASEPTYLSAGYRFLGAPDFLVDSTFSLHQPVTLHGGFVEYGWGDWKSHWVAGAGGAWSSIPEGNWQGAGTDPESTAFLEWGVGFLGIWAGREWNLTITEGLFFSPTLALGAAAVLGNVYATEVIPGCVEPTSECGHWRRATREPIDFSYRIMPVVLASGSIAWRFRPDLTASLDFGFLNIPFAGLAFQYHQ